MTSPRLGSLVRLAALAPDLVPARVWLDRLDLLVPGPAATRWLLIPDLACLVALGAAARWPPAGIAVALGVGFAALNLVGMAVNDFYVGLALFHLAVGAAAALGLRRRRWAGLALVALALVLGIVT